MMNANGALDKAWETKSLKEIVNAPVDALQGVSAKDAELLKEAFGIKTIADMARNKYFHMAQALVTLSEYEENK